jgi:hypothetical protein
MGHVAMTPETLLLLLVCDQHRPEVKHRMDAFILENAERMTGMVSKEIH